MTKRALSCVVGLMVLLILTGSIVQGQDAITNTRVIEMTKLGLDDEIVIAKIKAAKCSFQLADTDLVGLKAAGVSSKVVAAMLDASVITEPRITVDGQVLELHALAQAKVGGRFANAMTGGIKSVKWKAYLQGAHASVRVGPASTIGMELPKGMSPDGFLLVILDEKDDRREIEVASSGGMVGAKSGIKAEAIIKTSAAPLGGNTFSVSTSGLKSGEYILYEVGSADTTKGLHGKGYDFGVK